MFGGTVYSACRVHRMSLQPSLAGVDRPRSSGRSHPWLEWVLGALLVTVLIGSMTIRPMSYDEGIWVAVARAWVQDGVPPYQGPVENKTPGIFYVFALSYLATGPSQVLPRIAGLLALAGVLVILYRTAHRLAGREAALATVAIGGLAVASRAFDGPDMSASESFMILGTTGAVALAIRASGVLAPGRRRWGMVWAGAALGVGIAFKQVGIFTSPVLVAVAWALTPTGERSIRRLVTDTAWLALGCVAATVASLIPLLAAGVSVREYIDGAWLILMDKGSHGTVTRTRAWVNRPWLVPALHRLGYAAAFFLGLRRRVVGRGIPWAPIALWMLLDTAGAFASGFYFPHQFKQVVPSMALGGGIVAGMIPAGLAREGRGRFVALCAVLVGLVLFFMPLEVIESRFQRPREVQRRLENIGLGHWIRDHTAPTDHVFVHTGGGLILTATERRPSSPRYVNRNFITSERVIQKVLEDLAARPPRVVVIERRGPTWLQRYVEACCDLARESPPFRAFLRRSP